MTGKVSLDGQPLPHARVVFQPTQGEAASPSSAETEDDGTFRLAFNREREGAMLGDHRVRVTTATVVTDASGQEKVVPERVPTRYNYQSELQFKVQPSDNHFDISLQSQGGVLPVEGEFPTDNAAVPNPCP